MGTTRLRDPRVALGIALAVGLAIRLARVATAPLIHPDGPAYLALASAVSSGEWGRVLGNYYSPLYPILIAPLLALGVPAELAGRLVATFAGLAALPLLARIARAVGGEAVAAATVLVAALQPALVKAAAQVQPETLAGLCLLGWGVVLMRAARVHTFAAAGALAGATYLARPEGVLLVPIGVLWLGRRRAAGIPAYALAACIVMAPVVLALHARTGTWQLSPREAAVASRGGAEGETSLAAAFLHAPRRMLARWGAGVGRQTWDTAVALGPVLAIPFVVGLGRAPRAWPLAVAAAFVAGPLALNPSPRYAVPVLPLLLPWVGAGVLVLAGRLGRRSTAVFTIGVLVLAVQGLWKGKAFDERCSREVGELVRSRYGSGQALVAVDGRFAYVAGWRPVVPKSTGPQAALALARAQHARLWLTRPWWLGKGFVPPPEVHEVARPCDGAFVLVELDE